MVIPPAPDRANASGFGVAKVRAKSRDLLKGAAVSFKGNLSGNSVGETARRDGSPLAAAPTPPIMGGRKGKGIRGITGVTKKIGFRRSPEE